MSKINYLVATTAAFVLAASFSSVALAWHPQGKITKLVQNVTTSSSYADANDAASAIVVRPGDTLKYKMVVTNPASAADKQWNDLAFINVTDSLPSGVTLVSGNKDKNFGSSVVVPQSTSSSKIGSGVKSVEYEFTVKVNADVSDKQLICNVAKFTGNSIVKDAPRSGEDKACVKVTVPVVPTPVTSAPVTPTPVVATPAQQVLAATLPSAIPSTGFNPSLAGATGIATVVYAVVGFIQSRRR